MEYIVDRCFEKEHLLLLLEKVISEACKHYLFEDNDVMMLDKNDIQYMRNSYGDKI